MTIIMARLDTTQRVLTQIESSKEVKSLQAKLRELLGGSWVWVQHLEQSEFVHFDCGEVYEGFDGREGNNYCSNAVFKL